MRVFVSYRRTWFGAPSRVVLDVVAALEAAGVDVVFDRHHVRDQSRFATELVDRGLNECDALVAVIDAAWLSPSRLAQLHASSFRRVSDDWVEFELRYAVRHGLATALVGQAAHLARVEALTFKGSLCSLATWRRFERPGRERTADEGTFLARSLQRMASESARRRATVHASQANNEPTVLTIAQARAHAVGDRWAEATSRATTVSWRVLRGLSGVMALWSIACTIRGRPMEAMAWAAAAAISLPLAAMASRGGVAALQCLLGRRRAVPRNPPAEPQGCPAGELVEVESQTPQFRQICPCPQPTLPH